MNIEIKSVKDVGSCNFCRRGKVDAEKLNSATRYPYTYIYEISGTVASVKMCEDCVIEFAKKMIDLPMISEMEPEVVE